MGEDQTRALQSELEAARRRISVLEDERDGLHRVATAARLSEERLQFVFAASRAGTWDLDIPTRTVYLSPNCKAIYGIAPEAGFDRETFLNSIAEEDRGPTRRAFAPPFMAPTIWKSATGSDGRTGPFAGSRFGAAR